MKEGLVVHAPRRRWRKKMTSVQWPLLAAQYCTISVHMVQMGKCFAGNMFMQRSKSVVNKVLVQTRINDADFVLQESKKKTNKKKVLAYLWQAG